MAKPCRPREAVVSPSLVDKSPAGIHFQASVAWRCLVWERTG